MKTIHGSLLKRVAVLLFIAAFGTRAFADEVNSTNAGLMLHGGVGAGSAIFGFVQDTDSSSALGSGRSTGFDLGMLLNYQFLAVGLGFTRVSFDTLEWDEEINGTEYKIESKGSGYFYTFDATLGLKLFIEPGDMGFTHFFFGFRGWKAFRDQKSVSSDPPFAVGDEIDPGKYEMSGSGWIAGFRDFSTLPLGIFSLALQSGLWIYNAPLRDLKVLGVEVEPREEQSIGFGAELGIGLAFEEIGLSILGGLKMDITATGFSTTTASDVVAGAGYAQFFLVLKKEFAL